MVLREGGVPLLSILRASRNQCDCSMRLIPLLRVIPPLVASAVLSQFASAQSNTPDFPRSQVLGTIRDLRRIATPEGIDTLFPVRVGDNDQWISIRGLNRANPVLLFIHGGPGTVMMPTAWAFQKPWEDFFTVVQWDQRGAGKSYAGIDTARAAKVWNVDDITNDAIAIIDTVRHMLGKQKVVALGLSWGSAVGVTLAAKRPDLLHAYVGTGQVVTFEGEKYLYERTTELARLHHSDSAIRELQSIAPFPNADGSAPFPAMQLVRKWASRFNGGWYGQPSLDILYKSYALSPDYTSEDQSNGPAAAQFSGQHIFPSLKSLDLRKHTSFRVPMIFMQGRYDLYTPFVPARDYVASIKAPIKKFIPFERGAHFLMFEQPGEFLLTLVREVLPLTKEGARFGIAVDAPR